MPRESIRVERFSHFADGNNRYGLQRPEKIKEVKKIRARARQMLQHGVNDSVWTSGSREVGGSCKKFTGGAQKEDEFIKYRRHGEAQTSCHWLCNAMTLTNTEKWGLR